MIILIMGVSGSGKTKIGKLLSDYLGWTFIDADDFHPETNKSKMKRGIPLTDEDRIGWLKQLHETVLDYCLKNRDAVLACSALKESYRKVLLEDVRGCAKVVYLKCDYRTIKARLDRRENHFFNPVLLKSQFETLEEPSDGIVVDACLKPEEILKHILHQIR